MNVINKIRKSGKWFIIKYLRFCGRYAYLSDKVTIPQASHSVKKYREGTRKVFFPFSEEELLREMTIQTAEADLLADLMSEEF